jgi:hypothetical protein
MTRTIAALFIFSMAGVQCLSAASVYQFAVNTSSLGAEAANLDFQLVPGGLTSPTVTAVISDLVTDGTFTPGDIVLTGDATGMLSDTVTLNNTTLYNDAFQPIDTGNSVSFLVTFSGPGIDTPVTPGTVFAFSIFDSTGTIALLTTSPDGSIAGVTADSLGVQPFTNPATNAGSSAAAVALVTPEPESLLLTGLGMAAFAMIRLRRFV